MPFMSILFCLLKISINTSIKSNKSQKCFCSIKYHFSISLDTTIQISLSSHHLLHCQLVIKDFYNPTNKSLQELGFIVSIVKVCYRSIKTSFNEAGFIGSDNTGILTF